jgi:DNA-binding LacI/PurR family transcriptional regulator
MLPELDTPYFAEVTRALVEQGARHGLTVVIDQTDGERTRELSWIRRASAGSLFDGLVLSPLTLGAPDLDMLAHGAPVVFLGEDEYPGFDQVTFDDVAASREVVAHFVAAGRRRVAAIGAEDRRRPTSAHRLAGWNAGLADAGLPAPPELVGSVASFTCDQGRQAMLRLLDLPKPPDAVYCFSDPLALGALRALYERGVSVPGEVAVAGFDDTVQGRFSCPTLTSVRPDKQWLARTVFDRLLGRLAGQRLPPETIYGPHTLVVRESSP